MSDRRVEYRELKAGDEIEVYVCDGQLDWRWERRIVQAVRHFVTFVDPATNDSYIVRPDLDKGRLMRRRYVEMPILFEGEGA